MRKKLRNEVGTGDKRFRVGKGNWMEDKAQLIKRHSGDDMDQQCFHFIIKNT